MKKNDFNNNLNNICSSNISNISKLYKKFLIIKQTYQ